MITQEEIKKLEELREDSRVSGCRWKDKRYYDACLEAVPALISTIRELREQREVAKGKIFTGFCVACRYTTKGWVNDAPKRCGNCNREIKSKLNDTGGE